MKLFHWKGKHATLMCSYLYSLRHILGYTWKMATNQKCQMCTTCTLSLFVSILRAGCWEFSKVTEKLKCSHKHIPINFQVGQVSRPVIHIKLYILNWVKTTFNWLDVIYATRYICWWISVAHERLILTERNIPVYQVLFNLFMPAHLLTDCENSQNMWTCSEK